MICFFSPPFILSPILKKKRKKKVSHSLENILYLWILILTVVTAHYEDRVLGQFWLFILSPREVPLFLFFYFLFLPPSVEAFTRKLWQSSHCCITAAGKKKRASRLIFSLYLKWGFFLKNMSVKGGVHQTRCFFPPTNKMYESGYLVSNTLC